MTLPCCIGTAQPVGHGFDRLVGPVGVGGGELAGGRAGDIPVRPGQVAEPDAERLRGPLPHRRPPHAQAELAQRDRGPDRLSPATARRELAKYLSAHRAAVKDPETKTGYGAEEVAWTAEANRIPWVRFAKDDRKADAVRRCGARRFAYDSS